MAQVTETFFSLGVRDMKRATTFYVEALGAEVSFASPAWSSLHVAGVRIGLAHIPGHAGGRVCLHFAVPDLQAALAAIAAAGGGPVGEPTEVAPGVVVADVLDTEGNTFALRGA